MGDAATTPCRSSCCRQQRRGGPAASFVALVLVMQGRNQVEVSRWELDHHPVTSNISRSSSNISSNRSSMGAARRLDPSRLGSSIPQQQHLRVVAAAREVSSIRRHYFGGGESS